MHSTAESGGRALSEAEPHREPRPAPARRSGVGACASSDGMSLLRESYIEEILLSEFQGGISYEILPTALTNAAMCQASNSERDPSSQSVLWYSLLREIHRGSGFTPPPRIIRAAVGRGTRIVRRAGQAGKHTRGTLCWSSLPSAATAC